MVFRVSGASPGVVERYAGVFVCPPYPEAGVGVGVGVGEEIVIVLYTTYMYLVNYRF